MPHSTGIQQDWISLFHWTDVDFSRPLDLGLVTKPFDMKNQNIIVKILGRKLLGIRSCFASTIDEKTKFTWIWKNDFTNLLDKRLYGVNIGFVAEK